MMSEDTKQAVDLLNAGLKGLKEVFYSNMDNIKEILADLNKNIAVMCNQLNSIEEQTKKTNGRVNGLETNYHDLEKRHIQCPVNEFIKRVEKLEKFQEESGDLLLDLRWKRQNPEESKKLDVGRAVLIIVAIAGFGTGIAAFIKLFL